MKYYLNKNKQPYYNGGNYELHKAICPYYYNNINGNNFIFIGDFTREIEALKEAQRRFPSNAHEIDGCAHCCPNIHRR